MDEDLLIKGSVISDFVRENDLLPKGVFFAPDAIEKLGYLVDEIMRQSVKGVRNAEGKKVT